MKINIKNSKSPATLMQRGILYFKGKPFYIVEIPEDDKGIVLVYGVADVEDGKEPIKDFTIEQQTNGIVGGTALSDALKKVIPRTTGKKVRRTNPPLFIAPIVPGVDTVSGKEGLGFFEREPRAWDYAKKEMIEEKITMVFISLDSIEWVKTYITPTAILKDELAKKGSDLWL